MIRLILPTLALVTVLWVILYGMRGRVRQAVYGEMQRLLALFTGVIVLITVVSIVLQHFSGSQ